ncbi:unnamed protein product, partial [Schistocephalus solidus]|uniref:Coiled-coil domain-containing protein 52 n=1 Tax=Schistocephalus solidus TaxID=70667 RepID=A0A183TP42_SCHSO
FSVRASAERCAVENSNLLQQLKEKNLIISSLTAEVSRLSGEVESLKGQLNLEDKLAQHSSDSELYRGDNKVVIRQTIGIADGLDHKYVQTVSPPDENIIQQVPMSPPGVNPGHLLPHRKVEEGVGKQELVYRTGSQKKEAGSITATKSVGTQHSLPGSGVCYAAGV